MTRVVLCTLIILAGFCSTAGGAELWVDHAAAAGGEGSAVRPFQTITKAIQASGGGDVISVHLGTYPETLTLDKSGTPQQPTVLRAAPGERVIVSGFAP